MNSNTQITSYVVNAAIIIDGVPVSNLRYISSMYRDREEGDVRFCGGRWGEGHSHIV